MNSTNLLSNFGAVSGLIPPLPAWTSVDLTVGFNNNTLNYNQKTNLARRIISFLQMVPPLDNFNLLIPYVQDIIDKLKILKNKYICYRENESNFYHDDNTAPGGEYMLRENIRIENYLISLENKLNNNNQYKDSIENVKKLFLGKDLRLLIKRNDDFNELYLYNLTALCNNEHNFDLISESYGLEKMSYIFSIINLKNNLFYKYQNYQLNINKLLLNQQSLNFLNAYINTNNENLYTVSHQNYNIIGGNGNEYFNPFQYTDPTTGANAEINNEINMISSKRFYGINRPNDFHWKLNIIPNPPQPYIDTINNTNSNINFNDVNLYLVGIYYGFNPNSAQDFIIPLLGVGNQNVKIFQNRGVHGIHNQKEYDDLFNFSSNIPTIKKEHLCVSPVFEIQEKSSGNILFNFII